MVYRLKERDVWLSERFSQPYHYDEHGRWGYLGATYGTQQRMLPSLDYICVGDQGALDQGQSRATTQLLKAVVKNVSAKLYALYKMPRRQSSLSLQPVFTNTDSQQPTVQANPSANSLLQPTARGDQASKNCASEAAEANLEPRPVRTVQCADHRLVDRLLELGDPDKSWRLFIGRGLVSQRGSALLWPFCSEGRRNEGSPRAERYGITGGFTCFFPSLMQMDVIALRNSKLEINRHISPIHQRYTRLYTGFGSNVCFWSYEPIQNIPNTWLLFRIQEETARIFTQSRKSLEEVTSDSAYSEHYHCGDGNLYLELGQSTLLIPSLLIPLSINSQKLSNLLVNSKEAARLVKWHSFFYRLIDGVWVNLVPSWIFVDMSLTRCYFSWVNNGNLEFLSQRKHSVPEARVVNGTYYERHVSLCNFVSRFL
ncbi:uncharacterized protein BDR25DRAFT_360692 [Lindgomyces ingoldianus]|uniref:Uncharacterized protein n=1 Tax=Lindgomyces ingoldianus TaxID=673940 RepID=A0ACB6QEF0_9PLEO|nr:uncharacterized protein BDR25DRAFT_360692 [Lindgomyces ingoldianus]KAF2465333.1 hypothetical protein BDR25DRAFT_360692 [Lindgomyces ingoldianus]